MSLFPAYAPDGDGGGLQAKEDKDSQLSRAKLEPAEEAREAVLLASDSSDEEVPRPPSAPALQTVASPVEDFYLDGKADHANLGVTTLYYPGRPIYKRASAATLGCGGCGGGGNGREAKRRYYLQRTPSPTPAAPLAAERARALRQLISGNPRDEDLWLRYIDFQEEWAEADAWRAACEEAHARLSSPPCEAGGGVRVREALHRARAASLPREALLEALAGDLANEKNEELRLEGWLRLLWTLSGVGAGGGGGGGEMEGALEVQRAALGALQALPHSARAYPLVLYVYGSTLRAAGLWEQLVLLLELVCAVNYPPSAAFPPPAPSAEETLAAERRLQEAEDAVIDSGLPLSTVWVRVERLRAAAHWRPAEATEEGEADPQRAPAAAEVQELLRAVRPAAALLMCVSMCRLAQVPLLPASEATRRGCGAGGEEPPDAAGGVLTAMGRASRRLEPSHAKEARAHALRGALATLSDPPHCFSDDAGYLTWVLALWEACCGWMDGERRLALVAWRLRWLHALVRVASEEEARRLRGQARRLLKVHAQREPVAFALFARIEQERGEEEGARRAALQAVRAGAGASGVPRERALFAARVLRELFGAKEPAMARWAVCAAALGRTMPTDAALQTAPPPDVMQETLLECSNRCEELERRFESQEEAEEPDAAAARALTCGKGEWGAARVAMMTPRARQAELARLLAKGYARIHRTAEALQYWESCACALAMETRLKEAARQLQPLFPNNALLALACNGLVSLGSLAPRSHTAALAMVMPPLLRDLPAERLARACARAAARGKGGATLSAMRLEAEVQPHRLLLTAIADHPNHKWLYVRGATWVCAEAEAMGDAALERGLRAHSLIHELRPLPACTSTHTSTPTSIIAE